MRVLVLNTGSSSIKYQLIESTSGERLAGGAAEEVTDHEAALQRVVAELGDVVVDAVGHRVVHGGERFTAPTVVDDAVLDALRALVPLAPLHNPANISGIEVARRVWPDVPQVAVFDTAFHRTLPPHAYRYAVPTAWYERARRAPLRLPRHARTSSCPAGRRSCSAVTAGGARPDRRPSRQRRVDHGDRRRAQHRHVDGTVAARGPGDGIALRRRRPDRDHARGDSDRPTASRTSPPSSTRRAG